VKAIGGVFYLLYQYRPSTRYTTTRACLSLCWSCHTGLLSAQLCALRAAAELNLVGYVGFLNMSLELETTWSDRTGYRAVNVSILLLVLVNSSVFVVVVVITTGIVGIVIVGIVAAAATMSVVTATVASVAMVTVLVAVAVGVGVGVGRSSLPLCSRIVACRWSVDRGPEFYAQANNHK
jgi:hypothetical protein